MNHTIIPNNGNIDITGITLPITNGGTISVFDEKVRGEMITTEIIVNGFDSTKMNLDEDMFKEEMKKRLARQLAELIIENKLVEFTKQENFNTCETTYRARAYLTPDNQVRILRKASL